MKRSAKNIKKVLCSLLLSAFVATLFIAVSCGKGASGGESGTESGSATQKYDFTLSDVVIEQGKTAKISGVSGDIDVTWSSSDLSVATVTGGNVFAVSGGNAVITAEIGGYTAQCNVTVIDNRAPVLAISDKNINLEVGQTYEAEVLTVWGNERIYCDYSVKEEGGAVTAAATEKGVSITAIKEGESTVTVSTEKNGVTAYGEIKVNVIKYSVAFDIDGFVAADGKYELDLYTYENKDYGYKNSVSPSVSVIIGGTAIENADVSWALSTSNGCVSVFGNTISAVKPGSDMIVGRYTAENGQVYEVNAEVRVNKSIYNVTTAEEECFVGIFGASEIKLNEKPFDENREVTLGGKSVGVYNAEKNAIEIYEDAIYSVSDRLGYAELMIEGEDIRYKADVTLCTMRVASKADFLNMSAVARRVDFGGYYVIVGDIDLESENLYNDDFDLDHRIGVISHFDHYGQIRCEYKPFKGVIDGRCHTIYNMKLANDGNGSSNYAWVQYFADGGTLKNLAIDGFSYHRNCSLIYGNNSMSGGVMENVYVRVTGYSENWGYASIIGSSDKMIGTTLKNVVVDFSAAAKTMASAPVAANANFKALGLFEECLFENVAVVGLSETWKDAVMIYNGVRTDGKKNGVFVSFISGETNGVDKLEKLSEEIKTLISIDNLKAISDIKTEQTELDGQSVSLDLTFENGSLKVGNEGDLAINLPTKLRNLKLIRAEYGGSSINVSSLRSDGKKLTVPVSALGRFYGEKELLLVFDANDTLYECRMPLKIMSLTATDKASFLSIAKVSKALNFGGYFALGANIDLEGTNLYCDSPDKTDRTENDYRIGVVRHYDNDNKNGTFEVRVDYEAFVGTIDGCGYTVSNMTVKGVDGSSNNYAWIQYLGGGGTLKNIAIDGFSYNRNCALIYGNNYVSGGVIENVYVRVTGYSDNRTYASIFGSSDKMINATVKNVVVDFSAVANVMATNGVENNESMKAFGVFENSTFENVAIYGLAKRWNNSVLIDNGVRSDGVSEGIYVRYLGGETNGVEMPDGFDETYWEKQDGDHVFKKR